MSVEDLFRPKIADLFRVELPHLERQGRLGNQLFQISAAFGYALDMCVKNCSSMSDDGAAISAEELTGIVCIPNSWSYREYFPFLCSSMKSADSLTFHHARRYTVEEQSFSYRPWVCLPRITHPTVVQISGYFQSEKYFMRRTPISFRGDMGDERMLNLAKFMQQQVFRFRSDLMEDCTQFMTATRRIEIGKSCSVHVRRGDYLQSPGVWPPCQIEYYISALVQVQNRMPELQDVCVFSDDPSFVESEWIPTLHSAHPNFTFHNMSAKVSEDLRDKRDKRQNAEVFDLCCMSLCRAHIIANSTFSWWGSYLGMQRNSDLGTVVIAPATWFGTQAGWINRNTRDVYRSEMIRL